MAFKFSYHLQLCRLPKLDAGGVLIGGTTSNGLQVLLPLTTVPITQARHWRGISSGSRLQMAFKSSYHLQPCRFLKLDAGGCQLAITTTNGIQVLLPPAAMPVIQAGCWGVSVRSHNYKWPSSPPTTCSGADHPSWMLEGH